VLKQTSDPGAHIFAFEEGRRHFVNDLVCRANAMFQIRSDDSLTRSKS
jgi:hypothetical protein